MPDSTAWRGVTPVFMPAQIATMSFQQCVACGALLNDSGLWQHQQWHESLPTVADVHPTLPIVNLPMPSALEELMAHIDALYIFIGEDPPFNVGVPRAG